MRQIQFCTLFDFFYGCGFPPFSSSSSSSSVILYRELWLEWLDRNKAIFISHESTRNDMKVVGPDGCSFSSMVSFASEMSEWGIYRNIQLHFFLANLSLSFYSCILYFFFIFVIRLFRFQLKIRFRIIIVALNETMTLFQCAISFRAFQWAFLSVIQKYSIEFNKCTSESITPYSLTFPNIFWIQYILNQFIVPSTRVESVANIDDISR